MRETISKIVGECINIKSKTGKSYKLCMQISQKGLYIKIMGGKKPFVALAPKKEVAKILGVIALEWTLTKEDIDALWSYLKKGGKKYNKNKKEYKKKEENDEEIELL